MNSILKVREAIYEHIETCNKCDFHQTSTHNSFIIYCVSKDTIQDTAEALWSHRRNGFSKDTFVKYIEYYGLLQAIYLQQDAISALYKLFIGNKPDISSKPCWNQLRNLRHCTAGHPVGRRKFLSRNAISYNEVEYTWWPEGKRYPKNKIVNLSELLDKYSLEATSILQSILKFINQKCPNIT